MGETGGTERGSRTGRTGGKPGRESGMCRPTGEHMEEGYIVMGG